MRPMYETPEDRAAQRATILRVEAAWPGMVALEFGEPEKKPARIDYLLTNGARRHSWAEIKTRTTPHDEYPTYMISLAKIQDGLTLSEMQFCPFLLIVRFTDGIYWISITNETEYTVKLGGRRDRGDAKDEEDCAFIDMKLFTKLKEPALPPEPASA